MSDISDAVHDDDNFNEDMDNEISEDKSSSIGKVEDFEESKEIEEE